MIYLPAEQTRVRGRIQKCTFVHATVVRVGSVYDSYYSVRLMISMLRVQTPYDITTNAKMH